MWIQIKCLVQAPKKSLFDLSQISSILFKSPSLAKLADGSVGADFTGDVQLGRLEINLNQGSTI